MALNKVFTEELVLPVDVGRESTSEAVLLVIESTSGSEAVVASTVLGEVGNPLPPVNEGRTRAELVLPATEVRI